MNDPGENCELSEFLSYVEEVVLERGISVTKSMSADIEKSRPNYLN